MHEIRSSILAGDANPTTIARKGKSKREGAGLGGLSAIAIRREEARVTDQRGEDRLRDRIEQSTIHFRRRKHVVRVVNVSSRGAMIESDIEPRIGEALDIQFSEDNRTRCVVRWVREHRIGLEFVDEVIVWDCSAPAAAVFQPAPPSRLEQQHQQQQEQEQEQEQNSPRGVVDRSPRHTLLRKGTLYWGGVTIEVRLRNISTGGAKIESDHDLRPGSEVELDLGEAGFQMAEVRWSEDGQLGLRFADDFDIGSLAPSSTAPASEPSSDMLKPAYLETELRSDSPWASRFERLSMT
ncbi:MAG: PilZ domain-containing protein, partial [Allosphingosinicella sp.]